jgi:purine nucleoside permease
MLYPYAYCTADGSVCQATMGEGEINAASSMMALVLSRHFDLRSTYFLFAGIAGVNPRRATLGSVALARYAVQVALQYEIDPRSLPNDWPTGYIPFGRDFPLEYPTITYGTEVFELDSGLRDAAYQWASSAVLADDERADAYRCKYADMGPSFSAAVAPPSVVRCDTATSDVYYSGTALAESFENATTMWTNGTGVYCMTAQEDNANLEVMVRAAIDNLVDFSRIVVMRTGEYGPSCEFLFAVASPFRTENTEFVRIQFRSPSNRCF